MKRARPDLETTVAFCCTRVTKIYVDDWEKLRRCIAFIKSTIDDPRIIGASILSDIFTWIDAAYTVHTKMRIQIGGDVSLGHDVLYYKSGK